MADESNDRRVMIAILLTSTLLTMLGIAGIVFGSYELQAGPLPENLEDLFLEAESADDEELALERELKVQMLEAQATNPYRRPMAAANVVVSALVLIGSFLLSWRRKLSQWWIRQAVVAKLLWIVGYTATVVYHLEVVFPTLPIPTGGGITLSQMISNVLLGSAISAALHILAAWRVSRSDIADFIDASRKSA